jgi:amino-acid N-acetyltransferase
MFRGSANYIANHRGTTAVYHIPGGLVDSSGAGGSGSGSGGMFRDLMNDVALTWLLGMRIVLVVGCRHQIERRLGAARSVRPDDRLYGLRVTDEETLRVVKEEAGYVRFEVERQLARSLRVQGAGATTASPSSSQRGKGGGAGSGSGNSPAGFTHHHSGESVPPGSGGGGYYDGNVVSGNFYSAQPFGILDGVDYSEYSGAQFMSGTGASSCHVNLTL